MFPRVWTALGQGGGGVLFGGPKSREHRGDISGSVLASRGFERSEFMPVY